MTDPMTDPHFPIGPFDAPSDITPGHITAWIESIARLPADARHLVEPLSDSQLDTAYRTGGWTARQVVHHLADSHLNSFIRFKWALTEDRPMIKAYDEKLWAELPDGDGPIAPSLALLEGLHARWTTLLRALRPEQLDREFVHPDSGPVRLAVNVGIYAWHGEHHLAHIQSLVDREGWVSKRTARA